MSMPSAVLMPTPGTCVAHGHISLKTKALFSSKKFRPGTYWAVAWPSLLLIFATKKDMALWLSSPQRGNGIDSQAVDVLDGSVKALLNLDPSGIVQRRERKERRRLEKEASRKEKKARSKSSSSKSKSSGSSKDDTSKKGKTKSAGEAAADAAARYTEIYSLGSVQFSEKDQMHVLTIEKTTRTGSSVALCVGSKDPSEVEALRDALESILALIDGDKGRCKFITPIIDAPENTSVPKKEIVDTSNGRPPRPTSNPQQQSIAGEALLEDGDPDDSFESFCTSLSAPLPCIVESTGTVGSETRSAVSAAS